MKKNKLWTGLLVLAMIVSSIFATFPISVNANLELVGDGTQNSPFVISDDESFDMLFDYIRNDNTVVTYFYCLAENAEISVEIPGDIVSRDVRFIDLMSGFVIEEYHVIYLKPAIFPATLGFNITIPHEYKSHARTGEIFVHTIFTGSGSPEYGANIDVLPIGTSFTGAGTTDNPFIIHNVNEYKALKNEMYGEAHSGEDDELINTYFVSYNDISDGFSADNGTTQSYIQLRVGNKTLNFGKFYTTGSGPRQPFFAYKLNLPYGYSYQGSNTVIIKYSEPPYSPTDEEIIDRFGNYPIVEYGSTIVISKSSSGNGPSGGGKAEDFVEPPAEIIEKSFVGGYPDGTFKPDGSITRAEAATIIANMFDAETADVSVLSRFSDVGMEHWAVNSLAFVVSKGYMKGDSAGIFRPDEPISRAEFVQLLMNLNIAEDNDGEPKVFSDVAGHWAENAIDVMSRNGSVNGYPDGTFKAENSVTRAEAVTMLSKLFKRSDEWNGNEAFVDVTADHWAYKYIMNAVNGK